MSDDNQRNKNEKDGQEETVYSDLLDALDSPVAEQKDTPLTGLNQADSTSTGEQEVSSQSLFPYAPAIDDPNAYPDFQGAKFYYDTRDYDRAIFTLMNIFRAANLPTDQNMASELVLEMAKTDPKILHPLLPYIFILEGSEDPIINMNINNALIYLRDDYNATISKLKAGIKSFIESYYKEQNTTYIPFMDILIAIGTSMEVVIKILEQQTKNREIPGKLDFASQVFAYEPPGALFLCPHCGVELDKDVKYCSNPTCSRQIFKCAICFRFIRDEELVKCPKCGITAHEQHFLEWVKKTGSCPVCQNKLYEQEVAKVKCVVCGVEIKSTEKPETLIKCPHCGILAHRDHFLDYLKMSSECPECKEGFSSKEIKKLIKMKK